MIKPPEGNKIMNQHINDSLHEGKNGRESEKREGMGLGGKGEKDVFTKNKMLTKL